MINHETQEFIEDALFAERRFGRIDIAKHFYECDSDMVQKVFSLIIPTEVTYDYEAALFRIKGLSKHFDSVKLGDHVPYYEIAVRPQEEQESIISFRKI